MRSKTKSKGQNKKLIRNVLLKIIFLVVLGFLLLGAWEYTKPNNFPVKNVRIFATYEHVDKKSLQDVVSSYLHNGFFYLNVIGLKKRLLGFPWVYAVSIKREFPDTVSINIVEERAILRWGEKALINSFGDIFVPPKSTLPNNLPIIFGPEGLEPEILKLYKKMQVLFEPLDLRIRRLLLNPRHYWEVLLNNGATVYLKEEEPLDQLELLTGLYRKVTASRKEAPKSIDLRYQSGLAVKW